MKNLQLNEQLFAWIEAQLAHKSPLCLGICGAQGSGKSTLAKLIANKFESDGRHVALLSLDDLYFPRDVRKQLAREIHPLLATRGVPGTHDVALGIKLLQALRQHRIDSPPLALPRFDKANDNPHPRSSWPQQSSPVDLVIFEGWCVGVPAQTEFELSEPINALERDEDKDGHWRRWVNQQLANAYQTLWAQIDQLIYLQIPDWPSVLRWRTQQEQDNACVGGKHLMDKTALARFVQHYERLSLHAMNCLPEQASVLRKLGPEHELLSQDIRQ